MIWRLAMILFLLYGCGDDIPDRRLDCAASCEERGGEFLLVTKEGYCYCAWYGDGGGR